MKVVFLFGRRQPLLKDLRSSLCHFAPPVFGDHFPVSEKNERKFHLFSSKQVRKISKTAFYGPIAKLVGTLLFSLKSLRNKNNYFCDLV
jgi:hypothetical protein